MAWKSTKEWAKALAQESKQQSRQNAEEIRAFFRQLTTFEQLQERGVELTTRTGSTAAGTQQQQAVSSSAGGQEDEDEDEDERPAHLPRRRRGSRVAVSRSSSSWRGSRVFDFQNHRPLVTKDRTMDPAQTKNRTALQGVLAMLKGAQSPAQVAKVLGLAFQTDSLFTFGELANLPAVQALESTDQKAWLEVLKIYQYGTYRDYAKKENELKAGGVALDAKQRTKLRTLTFIILGSAPPITFDSAISALGITTAKEADQILEMSRYFMLAVDEGLINGRLDSQSRRIHIDEISPLRDVSFSEYGDMLATVDSWMAKTDEQLKIAEERARSIRQSAEAKRADYEEFESRREAAETEASRGRKRGGGAGGDGNDDEDPTGASSGSRNTRAR